MSLKHRFDLIMIDPMLLKRAATFAKEDKEHLEDLRVFAATIVSPAEIIQIFLFSLHARYVSFFLDNNNLLTE